MSKRKAQRHLESKFRVSPMDENAIKQKLAHQAKEAERERELQGYAMLLARQAAARMGTASWEVFR
jgi:hypothetical protein